MTLLTIIYTIGPYLWLFWLIAFNTTVFTNTYILMQIQLYTILREDRIKKTNAENENLNFSVNRQLFFNSSASLLNSACTNN